MILSAFDISMLCEATLNPMIDPFLPRTRKNGVTYGLSTAGYDIRCAQDIYLGPITYPKLSFILASSMEKFNIPLDILGVVHDKSTWARKGMAVQNTVLEPGWRGFLTLEISNNGREYIHIEAGTGIAQIIFHKLLRTAEEYEGKYQDQPKGSIPAIMEDDK